MTCFGHLQARNSLSTLLVYRDDAKTSAEPATKSGAQGEVKCKRLGSAPLVEVFLLRTPELNSE